MIYVVDKRFPSAVDRSARVMDCAEAFGLGLDDKEFVVFDNQSVEINQGDIVYITGQSGSGKSVLLRELADQMNKKDMKVENIDDVPLLDVPIVEQIGKNTSDAISYLCAAGLNDAYLFIRKPKELSDGQRYRFRVAKLIESGAGVWVADEFGAVLDRTTARIVAFNLQRQARSVGATVIVATTHKDLVDELGPNLYVEKSFAERVRVERFVFEDRLLSKEAA